jgi:hypothetical protein
MRFESSVVSVSWIPREAVEGIPRLPWDLGVAHYDMPPPDVLEDLPGLLVADAIRFANELRAWIEVDDDGRVTDYGHTGRGHIGRTTMRLGGLRLRFPAVGFADLRPEPEVGDGWVRFVQTSGGRPGMPAPRSVRGRPYVRVVGPTVWSTLALTIRADGSSDFEVVGASSFPRHWVYDAAGKLTAKAGLTDFKDWYRHAFGKHTPWGEEDSPVLVTAVETALERELSHTIMRGGAKPKVKKFRRGKTLVEQGQPGDDVFLLLDGVLSVEVDGELLADVRAVDRGRAVAVQRPEAVHPERAREVPDRLVAAVVDEHDRQLLPLGDRGDELCREH